MNLMLSRRQALKTGVAGLVSTSFSTPATHAYTTPFDMSQFCAAESTEKYELTKPWTSSGFRYATDQAICIRVMSMENDTPLPASGLNYPAVSDLPWFEIPRVGHWQPWPQRPPRGTGKFQHYAVMVGSTLVQDCYDELVRQLPNLHYALALNTSLGNVLLLRFQGGEGLLMPMEA